jgi:hypothetical protein
MAQIKPAKRDVTEGRLELRQPLPSEYVSERRLVVTVRGGCRVVQQLLE